MWLHSQNTISNSGLTIRRYSYLKQQTHFPKNVICINFKILWFIISKLKITSKCWKNYIKNKILGKHIPRLNTQKNLGTLLYLRTLEGRPTLMAGFKALNFLKYVIIIIGSDLRKGIHKVGKNYM